jgi:hypothetical protein
MFKTLATRLTKIAAAVTGGKAPKGGGGALPPVPPPKVKPKGQGYPGYVTNLTPSTSALPKTDLQLATTDIVNSFRLGRDTPEVLRNLARANPDLAASLNAYLRVGIPEKYIAIARDPDGSVNDDATRLAWEILQRFDKLPDYSSGFSQTGSIRTVAEALAKEGMLYGGMGCELVLDKGRLPYKFQPIHVPLLKFYEDDYGPSRGLRPVQVVSGTEIDLDIPTFFMVYLDPSLLDPYPQSPLEAAIQPVITSQQFIQDLRRVMQRHVYPRYDIAIDEEKVRNIIPPEILNGPPEDLDAFLNNLLAQVESTINELGVEEALVHWNFITVKYIEGDDTTADKFNALKEIIDANLAKGARTMPAVLGNGSGSQNVASTETLLFMLGANASVRLKLHEIFSQMLTMACRLFGQDVTVTFEFDEIELRPATELEAFKTMRFERLTKMYALGMIGAMEFCLRVNGFPMPKSFTDESGTLSISDILALKSAGAEDQNAYSGTGAGGGQSGGGAATQSRKSKTPEKSKGGQSK